MSGFKLIGTYSGYNPLLKFARNFCVPKFYGHQEIQAAQHYATNSDSPFVKDIVTTENTTTRLSLVYLHWWLLEYHLVKAGQKLPLLSNKRLINFIRLRQFIHLTELLIKTEHVQLYSNEYDPHLHDELRRTNLVLRHSLAAFFIHPWPTTTTLPTPTAETMDEELAQQLEAVVAQTVVRVEPEHGKRIAQYMKRSVENDCLEDFLAKLQSATPSDTPINL